MKKWSVILLAIFILLFSTSCTSQGMSMTTLFQSNIEIADNTFEQIISAVEQNDPKIIEGLFSETVRQQVDDLGTASTDFLAYITGEVVTYTSSEDFGVSAEAIKENGRRKREIQPCFVLETSEQKYYIAIRQCTINTFNPDGVGVISIYIINAEDWDYDNIYCADGAQEPGAHIDRIGIGAVEN